jgi:hypothetical protein
MSGACVATNGALGARGVLLPAMVVANLQKSYMFHKGTFLKAHSLCDSKSKIDLHLHSLASGSCLLALAVGACKRRRNFPASEGFYMHRLFAANRRLAKGRRFPNHRVPRHCRCLATITVFTSSLFATF